MGNPGQLRVSRECSLAFRKVLSRAVTPNHLLILSSIDGRRQSLTSFVNELTASSGVPESTLKLGIKTLRKLGLIELQGLESVAYGRLGLTEAGRFILEMIRDK